MPSLCAGSIDYGSGENLIIFCVILIRQFLVFGFWRASSSSFIIVVVLIVLGAAAIHVIVIVVVICWLFCVVRLYRGKQSKQVQLVLPSIFKVAVQVIRNVFIFSFSWVLLIKRRNILYFVCEVSPYNISVVVVAGELSPVCRLIIVFFIHLCYGLDSLNLEQSVWRQVALLRRLLVLCVDRISLLLASYVVHGDQYVVHNLYQLRASLWLLVLGHNWRLVVVAPTFDRRGAHSDGGLGVCVASWASELLIFLEK